MPNITIQDSGRGPVYSFGTITWHSPDGSVGFGEESIRNVLLGLSKNHTALSADLMPERVPERLFDRMGGNVKAVTRLTFEDARGEARAANEVEARFSDPARPVDPALAADVWGAYRSMEPGARATAIESADLTDLTALVSLGNRVPLDEQMWQRAVERYREENWIVAGNLAANHPAAVTIEQPLATGPDMDAARRRAREIMKEHAARLEAVKANEDTAKGLILFLAAVFAMRPDALLDQVMGAG